MGEPIQRPFRRRDAVSVRRSEPSYQSITLHFSLPAIRFPHLHLNIHIRRWLLLSRDLRVRILLVLIVLVLLATELITNILPYLTPRGYALGAAASLLSPSDQYMASKLVHNSQKQRFIFNGGYVSTPAGGGENALGPQITANAPQDASQGITVTDPTSGIDFTATARYRLAQGQQDGNRIVYPLIDASGWAVYSMHAIGVKEDVLLTKAPSNDLTLTYTLGLGNTLAARLDANGNLGVYGNTLLDGNIATATSKDAVLLQQARQHGPKNTLLFTMPRPTIHELHRGATVPTAVYTINGNQLDVHVTGLTHANYPLTIDPSIYVVTAQQFMQGNNETNIDFDVADKLIEKGFTTGARFNSWNAATNLNANTWRQGVAVAGGYIYTVGGINAVGGKVSYTTPGASTFNVPTGITSITVKMWGGGGGGGGGGRNAANAGGAGGGAGFTQATITVTPGETLNVNTGGGGSAGNGSARSGQGGGGGGYSDVNRSGTELITAAGGGGGGGGAEISGNGAGDSGFAGGGTTGSGGTSLDGSGGTPTAGGTAGSGGGNSGSGGSSLQGGAGGDGRSGAGADGGGGAGGTVGGGNGGNNDLNNYYAGGGGGGGGYFGGGSGSGSAVNNAGGGGGGGSSLTTGTATTDTGGSGQTPGNSSDPDIGSAGQGGGGGARRAAGTAGTGGLVIISYTSTPTALNTVNWAQFSTTDGSITSPNPGNGACTGWCTNTAYNLPTSLNNLSLIAYNGFLYAIGGEDSSCITGNSTGDSGVCNTVYIAKLGANGEPQLWSPTSTDQTTWTYWYKDAGLSNPRSYTAAVAYNNRMYLLGGKTSSGGTASIVNTAQVANINPTGRLGSWTTTASLPYNVYGEGVQVYNGYVYIIGGDSTVGGSPLASVYYIKIKSDGTLNDWIQTRSFATARFTNGGNFSAVWGGYIYLSGGCSAVNGSGYCTTVDSDTQLASINADGSLDIWNNNASVSDSRMAHNIVTWRDYIYELGGCSSQNTSTGNCITGLNTVNYSAINQDGDASTVNTSVASGTAPCSGGSPYNCNLPPIGTGSGQIGQILNPTAIMNGYLYVMGGCRATTGDPCGSVSANTAYAAISSTGTLTVPANCTTDGNTLVGAWCVDSTHAIGSGVAAAGTAIFNGRIYLVGGFTTGTNIYYNSVNSDGSLGGAWNSVTLTSVGAQATLTYPYAYTRANPSAAGTNPGNLYILGGCTDGTVGCSNYSNSVYKCNISTSGVPGGCSTTGQLQINNATDPNNGNADCGSGLGAAAGTVYANYIYLIGGLTPNCTDLTTLRYAKIDNNNNIVAVSGTTWIQSPVQTNVGRRRGAAFGYNGYLYVVGGYDAGSGLLNDIEFAKINVSDGSINAGGTNLFNTSSVTLDQRRWGLSVPVSNSFAYVIGGCVSGNAPTCNTGGSDATITTFQIYNNDSGSPAGYSTSANTYGTSASRLGAGSTILNGYIYVAGGCTSTTDCSTAISDVSYAAIDADGKIGTWASTTAALPAVATWGKLLSAGGSLYFIGGQNSGGTAQTAVYYATPSSGNITTWGTTTNGLPAARTKFGAAAWNNRLYVLGGGGSGTGCASGVCNTVYVSPQLNSGGNITSAWSTTSTSFNVDRSDLTAITYANNIYILGGYDGANYLSDVQFAQISTSNGSIGGWTYTTNLPTVLIDSSGFAVNGYIYLIGGRTAATTCAPVTLAAPVSANTTIVSGNNPTGVGGWYQTNAAYSGNRYGDTADYYQGKAYVLGGGCGSTLTYASPVTQQTSLLTQPQVAQYSIMIDTSSDVFPNEWLINGLDNSIGAEWQLTYESMTNVSTSCTSPAMTTWGQTTNFGNVALGTPEPYYVLNGSGTNIFCGRFFDFFVSIDSSQAYGYPDDVSRGPTITDLTLQFTADPSKRLMHGRTFTGGLQQPDDTPYYSH